QPFTSTYFLPHHAKAATSIRDARIKARYFFIVDFLLVLLSLAKLIIILRLCNFFVNSRIRHISRLIFGYFAQSPTRIIGQNDYFGDLHWV
ncbi:MAG: hypothetical protein J6V15_07405, partial [Clostridia bacterium]|nr:hypothetical protein [Clostridia bacterium]